MIKETFEQKIDLLQRVWQEKFANRTAEVTFCIGNDKYSLSWMNLTLILMKLKSDDENYGRVVLSTSPCKVHMKNFTQDLQEYFAKALIELHDMLSTPVSTKLMETLDVLIGE